MAVRVLHIVIALASMGTWGAWAQQSQTPEPAASLPEECRTAVQAGGQAHMMQGMDMQGMPQDMMATMTEAQKANVEAMTRMRGPMMMGIMAKDPDVAFICGMIPHHQGAVDMAEIELKTGGNPEARKFAEKVIKDQGREIAEMKNWLKKYAKTEGSR